MPDTKNKSIETRLIHGESKSEAWDFTKPLIPPISASTTFRLGSVERGAEGFQAFASDEFHKNPIWIYDRLDEPNTLMLESQLAAAEHGEVAVTFSTGMGAIASCLLTCLKHGQEVLSHQTVYGCTFSFIKNWLPKFGISGNFQDLTKFTVDMVSDKTRVIYFESVTNPTLEVIDFEKIRTAVMRLNKKRSEDDQILIVVDNTFATPYGCRPLDHGADFVVQSLTKNISGFGTEMGGAVVSSKKHEASLKLARKDFGAVLHPRAAWDINVHGLPTLQIRYERQQQTASAIAKYLFQHDLVDAVHYPGLENFAYKDVAKRLLKSPEGDFCPGYMIAFKLKRPDSTTVDFVNYIAKNAYSITLAVSLGLTKTLIELPNFMTHAVVDEETKKSGGVSPYLIRMSVGLENFKDLKSDLDLAFQEIKK